MSQVRDYYGVVNHNARKLISPALLDAIRDDGIGQDFLQEQKRIAIEAEQRRMSLRDASNFAQREIYRALCNYGYFRPKGSSSFVRRDMDEEQNEDQS